MSRFLPYGRQQIDDDDVSAVVAVLKSDWLTTGPAVGAFETALARAVDAPHAVACSSATAGLHLAALAAEIGPGDRAIVPTLTFLASANAIRYVGAEVIFADVDPDSGLMRPVDLEAAYRRAGGPVKAVIPVHYAGQAESPERIREIAAANGSIVIEDACHAIGASYASTQGPVSVGSCAHSEMAVFSFHPVKTVAMGEGGAVTTRDPRLAERLKRLSSHGMHKDAELFQNRELAFDTNGTPNLWYYEMPEPGFNYRASDIHCALGLSQLKKLHLFVDTRRKLVARYDLLLEPLGEFVRPLARVPGANPAWHLYVALIDFTKAGKTRMQIMRGLHQAGIGTQVHYLPVHLQPYYTALGNTPDLPGALAFYQRCLSLPLFASMTADDVDRVVWALRSVLDLR